MNMLSELLNEEIRIVPMTPHSRYISMSCSLCLEPLAWGYSLDVRLQVIFGENRLQDSRLYSFHLFTKAVGVLKVIVYNRGVFPIYWELTLIAA